MTLHEMADSPALQDAAEEIFRAAWRLPRPAVYAARREDEWRAIVRVGVEDLMRLAHVDGCVAAAWALELIRAAGAACPVVAEASAPG